MVIVPLELRDFRKKFPLFYKSAIEKSRIIGSKSIPDVSHYDLDIQPLHIFDDIVNFYNIHSLIIWPEKIHDNKQLANLYSEVYAEISAIKIKIIQIKNELRPETIKTNQILMQSIFIDRLIEVNVWTNYTYKLIKYYDTFTRFGMKELIEPIIDFIWKLPSHIKIIYIMTTVWTFGSIGMKTDGRNYLS